MTPKQFQKYLDRDKTCLHCGTTEALVPQHRVNRGMGGSKARNVPSNVIVLCAGWNYLIEANAYHAAVARSNGWKLESWQDPVQTAVYEAPSGKWWLLGDDYTREEVSGNEYRSPSGVTTP